MDDSFIDAMFAKVKDKYDTQEFEICAILANKLLKFLYETKTDQKALIPKIFRFLGICYFKIENYKESLLYLSKYLAIKKMKIHNNKRISNFFNIFEAYFYKSIIYFEIVKDNSKSMHYLIKSMILFNKFYETSKNDIFNEILPEIINANASTLYDDSLNNTNSKKSIMSKDFQSYASINREVYLEKPLKNEFQIDELNTYHNPIIHHEQILTIFREYIEKKNFDFSGTLFDPSIKFHIILHFAILYSKTNQFSTALKFFLLAESIVSQIDHPSIINVSIFYNEFICFLLKNNRECFTLKYFQRLEQFVTKINCTPSHDIATFFQNLAWTYYSIRNFEKSLKFYSKSFQIFYALLTNNELQLTYLYFNYGKVFHIFSCIEETNNYYNNCENLLNDKFRKHYELFTILYLTLAVLHYESNRELSLKYFVKAIKKSKKVILEEVTIQNCEFFKVKKWLNDKFFRKDCKKLLENPKNLNKFIKNIEDSELSENSSDFVQQFMEKYKNIVIKYKNYYLHHEVPIFLDSCIIILQKSSSFKKRVNLKKNQIFFESDNSIKPLQMQLIFNEQSIEDLIPKVNFYLNELTNKTQKIYFQDFQTFHREFIILKKLSKNKKYFLHVFSSEKINENYSITLEKPFMTLQELKMKILSKSVILSVESKLNLFRQLLGAFEFMKSKKIVHNNLNFENILIGYDYNIKICDFERSLELEPQIVDAKKLNISVFNKFTPLLAPEIFFFLENFGNLTKKFLFDPFKSDLFTVGLIFLYLLDNSALDICDFRWNNLTKLNFQFTEIKKNYFLSPKREEFLKDPLLFNLFNDCVIKNIQQEIDEKIENLQEDIRITKYLKIILRVNITERPDDFLFLKTEI